MLQSNNLLWIFSPKFLEIIVINQDKGISGDDKWKLQRINTLLRNKKASVGPSKITATKKTRYVVEGKGPFQMPWVKETHLQFQAYLIILSKNTQLSTRRTKSINQTSVHIFQHQSCKAKWFVGATKQFEYIIAFFQSLLKHISCPN